MQAQNEQPYKVSEFIEDVRQRVGDTSKSIPSSFWISYINTALRRLPRQDGLARLNDRHDTWELSYLNKDGTPSAAWNLGAVGKIIDIRSMRVLKTVDGKVCEIKPAFIEFDDFYKNNAMPDNNEPGDPSCYTIEQVGSLTRLIFNRPPKELLVLDMIYSAYFPRITKVTDEIALAWEFCDLLEEYVIILQKIESTDQSTARALYEDLDQITTELAETLARRKTALPLRRVARSW